MISPPDFEMHAGDAEYLGHLKEDWRLLEGVQVAVGVWVAEADEADAVVDLGVVAVLLQGEGVNICKLFRG